MQVKLAHPWRGNDPGDTIDVDDPQGRTLLSSGYALPVETAEAADGPRSDDEFVGFTAE